MKAIDLAAEDDRIEGMLETAPIHDAVSARIEARSRMVADLVVLVRDVLNSEESNDQKLDFVHEIANPQWRRGCTNEGMLMAVAAFNDKAHAFHGWFVEARYHVARFLSVVAPAELPADVEPVPEARDGLWNWRQKRRRF
jgi:hypothetical protein